MPTPKERAISLAVTELHLLASDYAHEAETCEELHEIAKELSMRLRTLERAPAQPSEGESGQ